MNGPWWSGAFTAQPGVRVRSDGSTLKGSNQNPVARWSVSPGSTPAGLGLLGQHTFGFASLRARPTDTQMGPLPGMTS